MIQPPSIRHAGRADSAEAARVLSLSLRALCAGDRDPQAVERWIARTTLATVGGWIASGLPRMVVAERDARILGLGAFLPSGQVIVHAVRPDVRFQGVSSALLGTMERTMKRQGLDRARMISTPEAVRFHAARGWQEAGAPVDRFGLPGVPMVKRLVPAVAGALPPPAEARRS
jgi:GNAT superfamily N-acetyltransferase